MRIAREKVLGKHNRQYIFVAEVGRKGQTRRRTSLSKRHVPFALVAVILLTLILAVLLSYVYGNGTLLITALVLLVVLALSLRAIQAINLFRPRRQKPQTNQSKNRLARAVLQKVFTA